MNAEKPYDSHNREERALCFHFFRLLHEGLSENPTDNALADFLRLCAGKNTALGTGKLRDGSHIDCLNAAIYPEVSLIRDFYFKEKGGENGANSDKGRRFTERVLDVIDGEWRSKVSADKNRESLDILLNPQRTNPSNIVESVKRLLPGDSEALRIFTRLQAYFKGKPDFAIAFDGYLMLIEAKLTERLGQEQIDRARNILNIWTKLLYAEFGFSEQPAPILCTLTLQTVPIPAPLTLGRFADELSVTWAEVNKIVEKRFPNAGDRTRIAFSKALQLGGVNPAPAAPATPAASAPTSPRLSCPLGDTTTFALRNGLNGARASLYTHLWAPGGHGFGRPEAKRTAEFSWLPIEFVKGHIVMTWNGLRLLVDTGAPISIGTAKDLTFWDTTVLLQHQFNGWTIEKFSEAVGAKLDVILGMDVLANYNFLIVKGEAVISFFKCAARLPAGIDMSRVESIPVVDVTVGGEKKKLFVDTGAKISYLFGPRDRDYPQCGSAEDFYPGYGQFPTDLVRIPTVIGGENLDLKYGALPNKLAGALPNNGVQGIIGTDLFDAHKVWFLMLQNQLVHRRV